MWGERSRGVEGQALSRRAQGQDVRLDVVELLGGLLEGAVHRLQRYNSSCC